MKHSSLRDRYRKSFEDKDTGASRQGVLDWRKLKEKVKFFKPKEGTNRINIIPYTIKTKVHPLVKAGDLKVGDLDYVLDIWVHRRIGPAERDVACLKKNWSRPCPICEERAALQKKGKDKDADAFKVTRRVFYNVQNARNPELGLMVFEASHFLFERELIEEARSQSDGEDIMPFADVEGGCTIKFRGSTESFGGNDYLEYKSFDFIQREEELDGDLVKDAVSFDELLVVPSYDEVQKILYGEDEPEEDDKAPAKESDTEEDVPVRRERPAARKATEDKDDPPPGRDKRVVETDEDGDKPARSSRQTEARRPTQKEEDRPVREERAARKGTEEDDDPPPARRAPKEPGGNDKVKEDTPKGKCLSGGTFGTDVDTLDACDKCGVWEGCMAASPEAQKQKA